MAGLYFSVGADFGKLQKLKRDIDNLKTQLRGMDKATNPKEFARLEKQLISLTAQFDREALAAQRAGAMTAQAGKNAGDAASDFDKLSGGIKRIGQATGIALTVEKIFELGREIKNVRGEIESMEKSFDVLLGGKDKADALIDSIKKITLKSNYSLTDLSGGAQTLLGFNLDESRIIPTLEQIGNIARGNKERFNSLTLAFAQMSSTGRLMGQDLLQMINAGFNPLSVISEKTGKSIGELKKEMENGAISSEMVADAFASATAEGGKFSGMMENQADSIKGAEAKLSGVIQDAFNDIGASHDGLIKGGYEVATALVQNYQTVGEVLAGLVATYGLYKAAIITTNAIEPVMRAKTLEAEAAALTKLLNGQQAYRISQMGLVDGSAEHVAAIKAEIAATAESTKAKLQEEEINLQALRTKRAEAEQVWMTAKAKTQTAREELASAIATAQAEAEAAIQKKMAVESEKQSRAALRMVKLQEQKDAAISQAQALKEKGVSAEKVTAKTKEIASIQAKITAAREEEIQYGRNVAAMRSELKAGMQDVTNKNIQTLSNKVNTLSQEENTAATAHNGYIKQMVGSKILIKKLATDAETAATTANTAVTVSNAVATNVLSAAKAKLIIVAKNLWAALVPNPYVLAAAAVVALGYGIYKLATVTSVQETAQKALNKVLDEAKEKKDNLTGKTDDLVSIVNNETKTVFERIEAYQKLQGLYPKYLSNMERQEFQAMSLTEQQKLLNKAINEFDISNKDAILDRYRNMYAEIQRIKDSGNGYSYDSAISNATDALDISFWTRLKMNGADVEDLLRQHIASLEEQKKQREENLKQAEFELKPENEKREILQKQLEEIRKQEESITENIIASGRFVKNIDGTISPAKELTNKFTDINTLLNEWNKDPFAVSKIFTNANPAVDILIQQLKTLNTEKQKVLGQLSPGKEPVINKESLENQVKAFKDFEASLSPKTLSKLRKGENILSGAIPLGAERYKELDELQKKYKELGTVAKQAKKDLEIYEDPGKANKSGESAAEKAHKQAEELKKVTEKQSRESARAAKDLEFQITEAEIKAKDEGSVKVLAQMDLNYEKEKEALKRQQEDALKTKQDNARAIFEADARNKGKSFDDTSIKLTKEELEEYQELQKKNEESYRNDKLSLELQYMRDYIKEYGTFQQKKLAIAQEYDKKIAASQNEWDRKSLENQKKKAISTVDFEAINKKIDWQGVFGNLTGMLDSQLRELLSNLKEYVKTDQFKASPDTDKKTIYDAIERLRTVTPGGEGTLNFNVIRQQMDDLGAAINRLQTATLNEKSAYENLEKAQKVYDDALKSGSQTIIESAKQTLDAAKTNANEASEAYKNAESDVENLGNTFKETSEGTVDGLNLVADGLHNFASNSLPQFFKGLQNTLSGLSKLNIGGKVGEAVGTLSKTLSSAGFIGQIISAVLSILDILKDGIGTLVANLIDTVLNAVDGILKNLLSGKLFTQIFDSLKNGIGNILNTISFGGFKSLINSIGGSNAKETAETISKLTSSNEALKVSIDALKKEMEGSNGAKSIQAYNEAVNAQKRYEENLRNILNAQMNYHGSHHSNSYYWGLNSNSLKEINKLLGTSLKNTWGDFSKLTADQMNEIRSHLPDIWSEMINQGKYGDRFKDDWNNYANQAGKVTEMTEDLRENIAQISFSSLRDSFVDALMNMDSDAKSFAGNFEEYLTKALLNFAIGDMLDANLKKWYESWTNSMNSQNGKLTEDQIEQYRKQWDDMVQEGLNKRDEIAQMTGYTGKNDSSQQSSKGVYQGMSQDTGDRLEARDTAIHMTTIGMDNKLLTISNDVHAISTQMITVSELAQQGMQHLEEIKTIQINSFYELKDINTNTKQLYQMNERLGNMNDKLERL